MTLPDVDDFHDDAVALAVLIPARLRIAWSMQECRLGG
jgi:hypothetical protein